MSNPTSNVLWLNMQSTQISHPYQLMTYCTDCYWLIDIPKQSKANLYRQCPHGRASSNGTKWMSQSATSAVVCGVSDSHSCGTNSQPS